RDAPATSGVLIRPAPFANESRPMSALCFLAPVGLGTLHAWAGPRHALAGDQPAPRDRDDCRLAARLLYARTLSESIGSVECRESPDGYNELWAISLLKGSSAVNSSYYVCLRSGRISVTHSVCFATTPGLRRSRSSR